MGVTFKSDSMHAKHRRSLKALSLAVAAVVLAICVVPAHTATESVQMPPPTLIPQKIAMGAFYNGTRVRVEGTAPADAGILVVVEGSERDEFFNRKGRVGPIWLTVDRIHVKHAPSIFLRFSSAPLATLVNRAEIQKYQLDEDAIMNRIHVLSHCKCSLTDRSQQSGVHDTVPDPSYARLLYTDFLQLKHHDGTYSEQSGTVSLTPSSSRTGYALEFEWPKKIPPGNYQVTVYACRGHRVIARSAATLQLAEVGFPEYMVNLAFSRPWIYGFGAVLAAVLAGFLTDLLTHRLRRKRRTQKKVETPHLDPPAAATGETPAETHEAETTHHG